MWTFMFASCLCGTSLGQFHSRINPSPARIGPPHANEPFPTHRPSTGRNRPEEIRNRRPGEFSNFVDLPSQNLRKTGENGQNQANHGGCALDLDRGGCITYEDVNSAFSLAARNLDYFELKFKPVENLTNEEMGNLGTVIHETTRILAKVNQG